MVLAVQSGVNRQLFARYTQPAVRFALDEARVRDIPQVVANQRALVNFSAEFFLRQLKQSSSITKTIQKSLTVLSAFSPLPLSVIAQYCGIPPSEASVNRDHLLDFALRSFPTAFLPHHRAASVRCIPGVRRS